MELKIFTEKSNFEKFILAGDIGGTNSNLALVGEKDKKFEIIIETITQTKSVTNFLQIVKETLDKIQEHHPKVKIDMCCISAAGPVKDNKCRITNADWIIDGNELQDYLKIPVTIINDFLALSYGIPLLDVEDENKIKKLPHADGRTPDGRGIARSIVGAGTGLGVGFIVEHNNSYVAFPSEGGHFDFPCFDEESSALNEFFTKKNNENPDVEAFASGRGLKNIFEFMYETNRIEKTFTIEEIYNSDRDKWPYLISKAADNDNEAKKVHRLFRKIYGKMAGNYAAVFLPTAGMYIAGGIISKDERHFLEDNIFMENFVKNAHPNVKLFLKDIPVFLVRDYSTSLLGAANAAFCLS
ncbi:MAG: glucokinase [Spirochaetales bacterium]|nr:glucokinase [Spirochaetales bacterium]